MEQGALRRLDGIPGEVSIERLDAGMLDELSSWPATGPAKDGYGNFNWRSILASCNKSSTLYPFVLIHDGRIEVAAVLKLSREFHRVSVRYVERRADGLPDFKRKAAAVAIDACVGVAMVSKSIFGGQGLSLNVQVAVHRPAKKLELFYQAMAQGLLGGSVKQLKQQQTLILGVV